MNYLQEIKAFYDLAQLKQLSTGQIALWNGLMYINNKCSWAEWFTVSNLTLQLTTGLSRSGINKNRNALKQLGLIEFKANGTKATSYKMITMSKSNQDSNQISNQVGSQDSNQDSSTLNKHKHKHKENYKKKFGEFQNVFFTEEQYVKLQELFPKDYEERIQKLDDYMQSTGKKYKDCLATIRNWARKEGYVFPDKTEYKEIDTEKLTKEEYLKLVRGEKDV